MPSRGPMAASPGNSVDLVHADEALLVLCKPAGMLAVPGRGPLLQDCLARRVQCIYDDALVVHRLDMATSGLIVMARGAAAQRALSKAFARREVAKEYIAVVAGRLAAPGGDGWGEIDLPLDADWPLRPRQKVDRESGKPALTRYRVLGYDPRLGSTRVALQPLTGRTHQLRVHLHALGHPIVGDALYAPPEVLAMAPRLLLHASAIALRQPRSGECMSFTSSAPF